jgi:hypothetical protein
MPEGDLTLVGQYEDPSLDVTIDAPQRGATPAVTATINKADPASLAGFNAGLKEGTSCRLYWAKIPAFDAEGQPITGLKVERPADLETLRDYEEIGSDETFQPGYYYLAGVQTHPRTLAPRPPVRRVDRQVPSWFPATANETVTGFYSYDGDFFYYLFDPLPYQLTFDANGGSFADGQTAAKTEVPFNTTATAPAAPVRKGYVLQKDADGNVIWISAKDGQPYDLTKPVTADATLYAIWEIAQTHTVTFDPNGGSLPGGCRQPGRRQGGPDRCGRPGHGSGSGNQAHPVRLQAGQLVHDARPRQRRCAL